MVWAAIDKVCEWAKKRGGLLGGMLGVAVGSTATMIEVGSGTFVAGFAIKIVAEVVRHGVERLLKPEAEVPDVKPAGQAYSSEQIDQINGWLEQLTQTYGGLLDRMEQLTEATGQESIEELTALVRRTLDERDDLRQQFDDTLRDVRRMTLSLSRIEEKLDVYFHVQQKVALSLEEIKGAFIDSPLLGDWAEFRRRVPRPCGAERGG